MPVDFNDITAARELAGQFDLLAARVGEAWNACPSVPALWQGGARDRHEDDLDEVDQVVTEAATHFRAAAARLELHAGQLLRQWQYEEAQRQQRIRDQQQQQQQPPYGQSPFGSPFQPRW